MISPYAPASFTARYNFISSAMFWLCFVGWRQNKKYSKGRKRRKKIVEIFVRIKKYCFNKKKGFGEQCLHHRQKSFQVEIEFVCGRLGKVMLEWKLQCYYTHLIHFKPCCGRLRASQAHPLFPSRLGNSLYRKTIKTTPQMDSQKNELGIFLIVSMVVNIAWNIS